MTNEKLLEVTLQYIPHGVLFKCEDIHSGEYELLPCTNISFEKDEITFGNDDYGFDEIRIPLMCLRSINCLTKPITVPNYNDGKEFVPIEELAKHFENVGKCELFHEEDELTTFGWSECHGDDYSGYCVAWNYERNGFFVYYSEDVDGIEAIDNLLYRVEYGYQVIDLMNQWLIDWRNLIRSGDAVAIE